jgi:ATP-dependent protease ClpP protease subunit
MMKHHHVIRITSQGYQVLASIESKIDALRFLATKDCRIGAVIYRDGTTGKRYSHNESRTMLHEMGE